MDKESAGQHRPRPQGPGGVPGRAARSAQRRTGELASLAVGEALLIGASQILAGSLVAAVAAYLSVRFLTRWFQTRTLTPFAIYCLVVGAACIIRFA